MQHSCVADCINGINNLIPTGRITMKRLLVTFMTAVMAMGFITACSKSDSKNDETTRETEDTTVVEISSTAHEPMFTVRSGNAGEYSIDDDVWTSVTYTVYYDGTIERKCSYTISDDDVTSSYISPDDYQYIYLFAENTLESDEFDSYREDACDGTTYTFEYYDSEGLCNRIYSGYCYANDSLQSILDIVTSYFE